MLSQNFRKKGTILRLPVFGYEEVLGGLKSHDNENQCFVCIRSRIVGLC